MTSSEVWNHFTKIKDKDMVLCSHCGTTLRRRDSSTKSLWGHLNSKHRDLGTDVFDKKRKRRVLPKSLLSISENEDENKPKKKRIRNASDAAPPSMVVLSPQLTSTDSINNYAYTILLNPINLELLKSNNDENLASTSSWSNSSAENEPNLINNSFSAIQVCKIKIRKIILID